MALAWYHEIAYAEPTILGTVGAGICYSLLFLSISSWEFGLAKHLDALFSKRFPRLYYGCIRKNYEDKEGLDEVWGMGDAPERVYITYFCMLLHHSTAGSLMYIGMVTQSPWIWRHGLLAQLFGSDLLDFARMAWCVLLPPGPYPTRRAIKHAQYTAFTGFHHSTSLLAGIPTSIYFADQPEFQFMGVLLAGYPMLMVVGELFIKIVDIRYETFHVLAELLTCFGFLYQRWYMFFPTAAALLQTVYASEIPVIAKMSLALGGLMMSLFSVLILQIAVKCFKRIAKYLRGQEAKPICEVEEHMQRQSEPKTVDVQKKQQSGFPTLLEPLRHRQQHKKP